MRIYLLSFISFFAFNSIASETCNIARTMMTESGNNHMSFTATEEFLNRKNFKLIEFNKLKEGDFLLYISNEKSVPKEEFNTLTCLLKSINVRNQSCYISTGLSRVSYVQILKMGPDQTAEVIDDFTVEKDWDDGPQIFAHAKEISKKAMRKLLSCHYY